MMWHSPRALDADVAARPRCRSRRDNAAPALTARQGPSQACERNLLFSSLYSLCLSCPCRPRCQRAAQPRRHQPPAQPPPAAPPPSLLLLGVTPWVIGAPPLLLDRASAVAGRRGHRWPSLLPRVTPSRPPHVVAKVFPPRRPSIL
jgi:hypothetical protein